MRRLGHKTNPWLAVAIAVSINSGCGSNDEKGNDGTNQESIQTSSGECSACDEYQKKSQNFLKIQKAALKEGELRQAVSAAIEVDHASAMQNILEQGVSKESPLVQNEISRYQFMKFVFEDETPALNEPKKCSAECQELVDRAKKIRQRLSANSKGDWRLVVDLRWISAQLEQRALTERELRALDQAHSAVTGFINRFRAIDPALVTTQSCDETITKLANEQRAKLIQFRQQRSNAIIAEDRQAISISNIKINRSLDLLSEYEACSSPKSQVISAIQSKYDRILELSRQEDFAYSQEEEAEVQKVHAAFGELRLKPTNESTEWESIAIEEDRPWSGYWYPFRYRDMFDGASSSSFAENQSPLEMFDQYLQANGREPGAADWERQRQEGNSWESSDGLCDAWSVAAATTKEPTISIEQDGIQFSPAHLKGLLVQKFASFPKDRYGIPYRGYLETDGLGQDLRPEAFHKLVTSVLAAKQVAIVDTDPNFPIWNMPLYRYDWRVEHDPDHENAFLVTAKPWYVKFRNKESMDATNYFVGRKSNLYLPTYKYRLYYAADLVSEEKRILYGEWLVDSISSEHPDTVYLANNGNAPTPRNPFVAENMDLLNRLLSSFEKSE